MVKENTAEGGLRRLRLWCWNTLVAVLAHCAGVAPCRKREDAGSPRSFVPCVSRSVKTHSAWKHGCRKMKGATLQRKTQPLSYKLLGPSIPVSSESHKAPEASVCCIIP